jgi:protocatechuate 3,4-dioxygenase beta subunit
MAVSPYCTIGPFFPASFVEGHDDLTHFRGGVAHGQHIVLSGRILQEGGVPTRNTILEIWQADSNGIFSSCTGADPGFAIGLTRRLVTTVFFADDPDAVSDPVLDCVQDAAARKRLFATRENAGRYRFDIVLRGENETPFFLD